MKKSVVSIVCLLAIVGFSGAASPTVSSHSTPALVDEINTGFAALYSGTLSNTTINGTLTVKGAVSLTNTTIQAGSTLSTGSGLTTIGAGGLTVNGASSLSNTTIQAGSTLITGTGLTTVGSGGITINGAASLTNTTIRPGSTLTVGGNLGLSQVVTNIAAGVTNLMYFYNGVLTNVVYLPTL